MLTRGISYSTVYSQFLKNSNSVYKRDIHWGSRSILPDGLYGSIVNDEIVPNNDNDLVIRIANSYNNVSNYEFTAEISDDAVKMWKLAMSIDMFNWRAMTDPRLQIHESSVNSNLNFTDVVLFKNFNNEDSTRLNRQTYFDGIKSALRDYDSSKYVESHRDLVRSILEYGRVNHNDYMTTLIRNLNNILSDPAVNKSLYFENINIISYSCPLTNVYDTSLQSVSVEILSIYHDMISDNAIHKINDSLWFSGILSGVPRTISLFDLNIDTTYLACSGLACASIMFIGTARSGSNELVRINNGSSFPGGEVVNYPMSVFDFLYRIWKEWV